MPEDICHSKPFIDEEDNKAVDQQISSGFHASASKTLEFENEFLKYIGTKYAKAVNSGTSALHLALLGLGVKLGDEVILPSFVFQAVLNAVNYTEAEPILVDLSDNYGEEGYNICAEKIKRLISKNTKAIIVPHMFGVPADLDPIIELGIPIIEDCAQSLGAEYKGKKIGGIGKIGVFSFYATKVISTGQGGMIVTNSDEINEKLNDLTKYDKREKYKIAYNYNLTDIQSSLGLSQLKKINELIKRRKEIAEKYQKNFQSIFKIPKYKEGSFPFRYIIGLENTNQRNKLQEKLKEKNIISEKPIFKPLHQYLKMNDSYFKNTTKAYQTALSIPIYPALRDEEVDYIIKSVLESY